MRRARFISSVVVMLLLSGCIYALRPYNTPSQQKLEVKTSTPMNCVVRVAGAETFPVALDGHVTFDVPQLPRGCDVYLFGLLRVSDGSPENVPAVHVLRGEKIIRRLSLAQLGRLPVDAEGYHILVLR